MDDEILTGETNNGGAEDVRPQTGAMSEQFTTSRLPEDG